MTLIVVFNADTKSGSNVDWGGQLKHHWDRMKKLGIPVPPSDKLSSGQIATIMSWFIRCADLDGIL